jgi:hypothetical protein
MLGVTVKHAGFISGELIWYPGDGPQTALLIPGGTLQGVLRDGADKPLAGVTVTATEDLDRASGISDATGTYRIDGLPVGICSLSFDLPAEQGLIIPPVPDVLVANLGTIQVPEQKAVPGIIVTGSVTDAATQAPVAPSTILVQSKYKPDLPQAQISVDKEGQFAVCLPAGEYTFTARQLSPEYLSLPGQAVTVHEGLHPLSLVMKPTIHITGTMQLASGQPVAGAVLFSVGNNFWTVMSDAGGHFDTAVSRPGTYKLWGASNDAGQHFEVVSPDAVNATKATAVTIVVKPNGRSQVTGQVVDDAGRPIAGAALTMYVVYPAKDEGSQTRFEIAGSGKDGSFYFPGLDPGQKATIKVKRPGYQSLDNVPVPSNKGDLGQLAMVSSNYTLHGQVLSPDGKPVPHALVAGAGKPAVTAPDGTFTLQGYPRSGGAVLAYAPGLFARATGTPGQDVVLHLAPQSLQPTDVKRGLALSRQLYPDGPPEETNSYQAQFASAAALPLGAERGSKLDQLADNQIELLQGPQAVEAAGRLQAILSALWLPAYKMYTLLHAAVATKDEAVARSYWTQAQALRNGDAPATGTAKRLEENTLWQAVAAINRFQGEAAAQVALQRAIDFSGTAHTGKVGPQEWQDDTIENALASHAATVAASPQLLQKVLELLADKPGYLVQALAGAIPVVARARGVAQARPLLRRLAALPAPALNAPGASRSDRIPALAYVEAVLTVIKNATPDEADEALELAGTIPHQARPESRLRALAWAGLLRPPAQAQAQSLLLPAAAAAPLKDACFFADQMRLLDKERGAALFAVIRRRVEFGETRPNNDNQGAAAYSFYTAKEDPARARWLLERGFEGSQVQPTVEQVEAMSVLSADRAEELADKLGGISQELKKAALSGVAKWLQADETTRENWMHSRVNGNS